MIIAPVPYLVAHNHTHYLLRKRIKEKKKHMYIGHLCKEMVIQPQNYIINVVKSQCY